LSCESEFFDRSKLGDGLQFAPHGSFGHYQSLDIRKQQEGVLRLAGFSSLTISSIELYRWTKIKLADVNFFGFCTSVQEFSVSIL
jgi:hypothetical protein